MASLNKVLLIGNLGRDVEISYTQAGKPIAKFSIACTESWKDAGGEKKEHIEWVNITAFGRLGEIAGEYLSKGSPVFIEGSLRTDKWTDKEGNQKQATKIIARSLQMLGARKEGKKEEAHAESPGNDLDDTPF